MATLCTTFQNAYNSTALNCVVDTSRNYNNNPPSTEWCNSRFGGIGRPPTDKTGYSNLDYLIWIKPAGESDGTCDGSDRSPDAMVGPPAGQFFKVGFISLWNNGYYVQEKGFPAIAP
jgi:cellulase/cellobiase CelA1